MTTKRSKMHDNGESIYEISEKTGLKLNTLQNRFRRGDSGARLRRPSGAPPRKMGSVSDEGETLVEISRRTGIGHGVLYNRYMKGDRGAHLRRAVADKRKSYIGFSVKQLGELIVKKTSLESVNPTSIGNFLRFRMRKKGDTEAQAVAALLSKYNIDLGQ